ncbi:MAG: hypothetical protein LC734_02600, partial [Acidobacteria bacterium]|nr:hypothetical protein [Acidobacteriota bacterium]
MKRILSIGLAAFCFLTALSAITQGQILLNEVVVNPPGTDDPCEYVELIGPPGAATTGLYFVSLEGDTNKGLATAVLQFGNATTPGPNLGSNGLLVVIGTDPCGSRTYPAGTTVVQTTLFNNDGGALQN